MFPYSNFTFPDLENTIKSLIHFSRQDRNHFPDNLNEELNTTKQKHLPGVPEVTVYFAFWLLSEIHRYYQILRTDPTLQN